MSHIAKALRDRGVVVRETFDRTPPEPVVFVWSWKWSKEILDKHPDAVVCTLDHGLFHPRNKTVVTSWMELNGNGEHPCIVGEPTRLLSKPEWLSVRKPWRPEGHVALIVGQCFNDVQILDHLEDYGQWLSDRADELRAEGWEVMFRPHPVQRRNDLSRYPRFAPFTVGKTLYEDLDQHNVGCVLGFNSNACLDAFLHGVQDVRVYNEGSMLWPITNPLTHKADPFYRDALMDALAYCQWDPEEIPDGLWSSLHVPIVERLLEDRTALIPWHALREGELR